MSSIGFQCFKGFLKKIFYVSQEKGLGSEETRSALDTDELSFLGELEHEWLEL
uniref:RfbR n=1 Tax=Vibrio parahaemolyticus TaxID=670 RepID=A0A5Q5AWW5_VIBPH|nr:rfbR [Vibrio parahaemolyticus]